MARFNSLPQLKAASRSDPTVLHPFIEQRNVLIGMKVSNPSLRLRDRQVLAHKVSVNAREMAETGLEAPPTFFVELWRYKELHGDPEPSQIVTEVINGVRQQGVEVEERS